MLACPVFSFESVVTRLASRSVLVRGRPDGATGLHVQKTSAIEDLNATGDPLCKRA